MKMLSDQDMEYYVQQSKEKMNMMFAGMVYLMEGVENDLAILEGQTWYQRISNTITGKNKMTKDEVDKNYSKIVLYVIETLTGLFDKGYIDRKIILSLGKRLNSLYGSQSEMKSVYGPLVMRLNKEIEDIDNFHILMAEITQGAYDDKDSFVSISKIMSQLDVKTIQDDQKMDSLIQAMEKKDLLPKDEKMFVDILVAFLNVSEEDAGMLSLVYGNLQDDYAAHLIKETVMFYYLMPDKIRKMKNRKAIAEKILNQNEIDTEYAISGNEFFMDMIKAYTDSIIRSEVIDQVNKIQQMKNAIADWWDNVEDFLVRFFDLGTNWAPTHGELCSDKGRKKFHSEINRIIDNLSDSCYIGCDIRTRLQIITSVINKMFLEIPEIRRQKDENGENIKLEMSSTGSLKFSIYSDGEEKEINKNMLGRFEMMLKEKLPSKERLSWDHFDRLGKQEFQFEPYGDFNGWNDHFSGFDRQILKVLKGKILPLILKDDHIIELLHQIVMEYPFKFDADDQKEYEEAFTRIYDAEKPYITMVDPFLSDESATYIELSPVCFDEYGDMSIKIRFHNMNIKKYTVSYHVFVNESMEECWDVMEKCMEGLDPEDVDGFMNALSGLSESDMQPGKFVDIKWGEWTDKDELELLLSLTNYKEIPSGELNMKIYVKEDPEIVGYIKI